MSTNKVIKKGYKVPDSVQFSHSVMSNSLRPHGLQHTRPPCSSPISGVYPNLCPLSWWCHPTILSSVSPSSPAFNLSQHLPMNTQDCFSVGWTGWISLQFKGLSRVFSNITLQKHQFFSAQPSLYPTLTSKHDYWKNHSLDYMDICWQSNGSAF